MKPTRGLFNQRDPLGDPVPGDFWWHPRIYGGCHVTVMATGHLHARHHTPLVRVRIECGSGNAVYTPVRSWAPDTFRAAMQGARLLIVGERQ